ncbi:unnamed protein product [Dovyalis caffra]|uniref:Uncharacterized protein n=1 Tax=Dovyalis caffra TaxID=77055 RepID=A0AAV1RND1_9ROSI|nr:unnamed protein product [Dovyalis caffra]
MAGKVVLITGPSSGIGKQIAYQYARRGARLALVARREDRLQQVANEARKMGSPDVITVCADVSKVEDCKRFVDEAMEHFGQMDHLVNNAGIACVDLFEEITNISDLTSVMDINFWGSVYGTYFAVPYLRRSQGKIIVISSAAGYLSLPRSSIYNASKAALISLYESLRVEFGSDIGITIVTPGLVKSEMTTGELQSKAKFQSIPIESAEECAKAIVDSACRGDRYLTEPSWSQKEFSWLVEKAVRTTTWAGNDQLPTDQHVAYEYARRGARLALAARREERLRIVAQKALQLGSPDVFVIRADVSNVEDCKRFVDEAANHFGQLDHLVNNAGMLLSDFFENCTNVSDSAPVMEMAVYKVHCTQFAIPHLKKTKGKIVGIASVAAWLTPPRLIIYNASKAALVSFYETLRIECGLKIGITIVTPGAIETDILTQELKEQNVPLKPSERDEIPKRVSGKMRQGNCEEQLSGRHVPDSAIWGQIAPAALIALFSFLKNYHFWRVVFSTLRTIFREDVAGKAILITGASSGIGEHLAYEYARRGACLALVARREERLIQVAAMAELIGSPEAIFIPGDVTKVEDCERFIDATVKHFGRLDHLVANAGVAPLGKLEDIPDLTTFAPAMDIKSSNGKIIAIASVAAFLPTRRLSFYNASKAAVYSMYETPRVELGSKIGITIVIPGLIKSEMTQGKFLNQQGRLELDEETRTAMIGMTPVESTTECAKAIVNGACRGEKYLVEPAWYRSLFY